MRRAVLILLAALLVLGCGTSAPPPTPTRNFEPGTMIGIGAVAFAPDGKRLLVGYGLGMAYGAPWPLPSPPVPPKVKGDKYLALWDVDAGREVLELRGHTSGVFSVAFSADGSQAISASHDHTIRVWDAATGKETHRFVFCEEKSGVNFVAFSADAKLVLVSTQGLDQDRKRYTLSLSLWDVGSGQVIRKLESPEQDYVSGAFSPRPDLAVTAGDRSHRDNVVLWNITSDKIVQTFKANGSWHWAGPFSPDAKHLVAERRRNTDVPRVDLVLLDVGTGQEVRVFDRFISDVVAAFFTADGKHVLCAAGRDTLSCWDVETGKMVWETLFPAEVLALAPDGKAALTATNQVNYPADYPPTKGVRLDWWDVATGQRLRTVTPRLQPDGSFEYEDATLPRQ